MKITTSERGFEQLLHKLYLPNSDIEQEGRMVSQSSIIGNYDDAYDRPGSSALWIGKDFHLNREEVAELVKHLQAWIETGSLA